MRPQPFLLRRAHEERTLDQAQHRAGGGLGGVRGGRLEAHRN